MICWVELLTDGPMYSSENLGSTVKQIKVHYYGFELTLMVCAKIGNIAMI